jgi:hypothetical protein
MAVTWKKIAFHSDIAATKLDDLTAPDDNTDLNASTSKHGLVVKATAPAANLMNVVGIVNGETVYTDKAIFDATNPAALGTAAPGTAVIASHRDHVHALPTGIPTIVRKTANETVNNSIVLQNDNELLFPVLANAVWEFRLVIRMNTSAVADINFNFAIPAGGFVNIAPAGFIGNLTTLVTLAADGTPNSYFDGTGSDRWSIIWGYYIGGANAGNVQLQWCQRTAEVSDTKVLANSFIIAHKLL